MTESNMEFVQDLYEGSARGDTEAFFAALSDDIEWQEAEGGPYCGVHHGPDEVAARPSGSAVAVVGRYTGKGRATGKTLDLPVVHVWDVRTGQIVSFRQFVDGAAFREVVSADAGVSA